MTNHEWAFSIEAVRQALGLERLLFLNDFTALALALPALDPRELRKVGGGEAVAGGHRSDRRRHRPGNLGAGSMWS